LDPQPKLGQDQRLQQVEAPKAVQILTQDPKLLLDLAQRLTLK